MRMRIRLLSWAIACGAFLVAVRARPVSPLPVADDRDALPIVVRAAGVVTLLPSAPGGPAWAPPAATDAAWSPSYEALIYATPAPKRQLVVAPLPARPGDVLTGRIVPLPPLDTALNLAWQWSASPDGRWLFVRRSLNEEYYWPHGLKPEIRAAEEAANWFGMVDLKNRAGDRISNTTGDQYWWHRRNIRGWRGGRALRQGYADDALLQIDPARPEPAVTLLEDAGQVDALSADGEYAVMYDGSNGDVKYTLWRLGVGPVRVLVDDPLRNHGSYADGASLTAEFSPDGRWLLMVTAHREKGAKMRRVVVELQSLDGSRTPYRDEYEVEREQPVCGPDVYWSPAKEPRFAYGRVDRAGNHEIAVVDFDGVRASSRAIRAAPETARQYGFATALWSPSGRYLAVRDAAGRVCLHDLPARTAADLGPLPANADRWSWAARPVYEGD